MKCHVHIISFGVSQARSLTLSPCVCVPSSLFFFFFACVLLFQLYLGFLLSLLFDLFSPSSRSPRGPGSCYLNVFLQEPLEEGDGLEKRERKRERMGAGE